MFSPPSLFEKTDESKLPYYLREQRQKEARIREEEKVKERLRQAETVRQANKNAIPWIQENQLKRLGSYQLFPADPFVASHHPICPRRSIAGSFSALSNNSSTSGSAFKPPFCNAKSCLFPPTPPFTALQSGPDDPNIPRFHCRRPTAIGQERQQQQQQQHSPIIQLCDDPPEVMENGSSVSVWACSSGMQLCVATAHTRGFRDSMEDVFIEYRGVGNDALGNIYVFGVCDGHGGSQVADWLHANLAQTIVAALRRGETLEEAFAATQAKLATDIDASTIANIGSTVCIAIVLPQHNLYYVANCGDSRAVLVDMHSPATLSRRITLDHKPDEPGEKNRIERHGGSVLSMFGVARLNGALSVSRGFGDNAMRPFGFTERPDVFGPFVLQETHPIILACDGLYDVVTDVGAAMTVAHYLCGSTANPLALEQTVFAQRAVEQLRNVAFASSSRDNISVMLLVPHKKML